MSSGKARIFGSSSTGGMDNADRVTGFMNRTGGAQTAAACLASRMTCTHDNTCWSGRTIECRETDSRPTRSAASLSPQASRREPLARSIPRDLVRTDVGVRCTPDGRAPSEEDNLRGLVLHPGMFRDLPRQKRFGTDIHHVGRNVRILLEEGFDLVQGLNAGGSHRTVLEEQAGVGPEQLLHILLRLHSSHGLSL